MGELGNVFDKGVEDLRKRITELEANLTELRDHRPMTNACNICWTSSWAPCEKGEEEAVQLQGGWVICQMCQSEKWSKQHRERITELEAQLEKE